MPLPLLAAFSVLLPVTVTSTGAFGSLMALVASVFADASMAAPTSSSFALAGVPSFTAGVKRM